MKDIKRIIFKAIEKGMTNKVGSSIVNEEDLDNFFGESFINPNCEKETSKKAFFRDIETMIITKVCNIAICQDLSPEHAYNLFIEQLELIDSFLLKEHSLLKRKDHFIGFIKERLLQLALKNIDLQYISLIDDSKTLITLIECFDGKAVRKKALARLIEITPKKKTLIPLLENLIISSNKDDEIQINSFLFLFEISLKKIKEIINFASENDIHLLNLIKNNNHLFSKKQYNQIITFLTNPIHKLLFSKDINKYHYDLESNSLEYNNLEIRNGSPYIEPENIPKSLDYLLDYDVKEFSIKDLLSKNPNYKVEKYLTICNYYCYDFSQKLSYLLNKSDLVDSLKIMRRIGVLCTDCSFLYYPKDSKILYLRMKKAYIKLLLRYEYSKLDLKIDN